MTLTPREYLHQHFGEADRRWIESLSDERCWEITDRLTRQPENLPNFSIWIKRPGDWMEPHVPGLKAAAQEFGREVLDELAKVGKGEAPNSGEYPNWR